MPALKSNLTVKRKSTQVLNHQCVGKCLHLRVPVSVWQLHYIRLQNLALRQTRAVWWNRSVTSSSRRRLRRHRWRLLVPSRLKQPLALRGHRTRPQSSIRWFRSSTTFSVASSQRIHCGQADIVATAGSQGVIRQNWWRDDIVLYFYINLMYLHMLCHALETTACPGQANFWPGQVATELACPDRQVNFVRNCPT